MSDRQFERAFHEWLEDGSDRTPPAAIEAVLFAVKTTPQQRGPRVLRRFTLMPAYLRYAGAVAIVAILGVGLLATSTRPPAPGTASPNPTVGPTVSPVSTNGATLPPLDRTGWTAYTSSRYGFTLAYPPTNWTAIPGDHDWTFENDIDAFDSTAPDRFETQGAGEGLGIRVSVWRVDVDRGVTLRNWIGTYCAAAFIGSCTEPRDLLSEVISQGVFRVLGWNTPAGEPMAAFLSGGGCACEAVYVLAIWRTENDPSVRPWGGSQRLLEAFLESMTVPSAPADSPAAQ